MSANRFEKQSYEEFTIAGDFVNNLSTGEGIASQTVAAEDKDGEDVSDTVLDQDSIASSGTQVSVLVQGGAEASSPYKITMKCVTDSTPAHKWEMEIIMSIKEK